MKRQRPVVEIEGTPFYVDVMIESLEEKGHPENRISFNVFQIDGDGYTFLYDREQKNSPRDTEGIEELGTRYCWVTLPALMELDAEGIAMKYGIPLEILRPDSRSVLRYEEDDDEWLM